MIQKASPKNIKIAVSILKKSGVVGMPTETVYGLAANAFDRRAVAKIFKLKGRPGSDPLIVHISDQAQLEDVADLSRLTAFEYQELLLLIKNFWPGPLTLVLPKLKRVPGVVTSGLKTVAVRMPKHAVARSLIRAAGVPLAAPSANRFQSMSPTTARAVEKELGQNLLILDGGPCRVGVESTVLHLGRDVVILRPGGVSREKIEKALKRKIPLIKAKQVARKFLKMGPGMMSFHYAPRKPLKVVRFEKLLKTTNGRNKKKGRNRDQKISERQNVALICHSENQKSRLPGFKKYYVLSKSLNLDEASRKLFRALRQADESKVKSIVAILAPEKALGVAINDRLNKAKHR